MKIYCDSSTKEACIVFEDYEPIRYSYFKPVTNNVGEYYAVLVALRLVRELRWSGVELLSDSQLVVNQVNGNWKCRLPHLLPLRDEVRELLEKTKTSVRWIPREENLAGKILG